MKIRPRRLSIKIGTKIRSNRYNTNGVIIEITQNIITYYWKEDAGNTHKLQRQIFEQWIYDKSFEIVK